MLLHINVTIRINEFQQTNSELFDMAFPEETLPPFQIRTSITREFVLSDDSRTSLLPVIK